MTQPLAEAEIPLPVARWRRCEMLAARRGRTLARSLPRRLSSHLVPVRPARPSRRSPAYLADMPGRGARELSLRVFPWRFSFPFTSILHRTNSAVQYRPNAKDNAIVAA